jgi:polysaccharide pyruvyl transferase WcaK-like protein
MDYFAPFWEGMAAIAARVPTCLWGVGYCDLKQALSTPSQAVLDRVVARSRLVVVRDQLTRDRFANQITAEPVACPAVVTLGASHGTAKGLLHAVHYDVVGSAAYGVMDRVGRAFAARTGRAYLQTDNQIMDGSEQELAERLRRYAAADLVLSSRLHGCIIGLAMGLKVLAVSGDWKLEAFMQSMGLEGWVLSPHRLDRLEDRLEALPSQPSVQAQLDRMRRSNRAVGASICRLAAELREMCRCDETRAVCGVAV